MPHPNHPAILAIAAACAATLMLAACGGDDEPSEPATPESVEACLEDQGMEVTASTNSNVEGFNEDAPVDVLEASAASTDEARMTFWSTEENAQDSIDVQRSLGTSGELEAFGPVVLDYGYKEGEAYPAAVECLS